LDNKLFDIIDTRCNHEVHCRIFFIYKESVNDNYKIKNVR